MPAPIRRLSLRLHGLHLLGLRLHGLRRQRRQLRQHELRTEQADGDQPGVTQKGDGFHALGLGAMDFCLIETMMRKPGGDVFKFFDFMISRVVIKPG